MEITKIFSDLSGEERLYSVLMDEEEMYLFSEIQKEFGRYKKENKKYRQRYLRSYDPSHLISEEALNEVLLADKLAHSDKLDKATRKRIIDKLEAASEGEGYESITYDAKNRSKRVRNIREQSNYRSNNIPDYLSEKQEAWDKTYERYKGTQDTGGRGGVRNIQENDYVAEINRKRLQEARNNGTLEAARARNQRARENFQKLKESTSPPSSISNSQSVTTSKPQSSPSVSQSTPSSISNSQSVTTSKPQSSPSVSQSTPTPGAQAAREAAGGTAQNTAKKASKGMLGNFRTWKAANPKIWKGTKIGGGIAAGVGVLGTGAYLMNRKKKNNQ